MKFLIFILILVLSFVIVSINISYTPKYSDIFSSNNDEFYIYFNDSMKSDYKTINLVHLVEDNNEFYNNLDIKVRFSKVFSLSHKGTTQYNIKLNKTDKKSYIFSDYFYNIKKA